MRPPSLKTLTLGWLTIGVFWWARWFNSHSSPKRIQGFYQDVERYKSDELQAKKPNIILIVSTWQSGSTFLGMLLAAQEEVFYHHEPLHYFGYRQNPSVLDILEAKRVMSSVLKCDFRNLALDKYMYHVEHEWPRQFSSFNPKFWRNCTAHSFTKHCFDRVYLWQHCRQHQVQAAKVVRLDLRHVEDLLKDPRLAVKVVFWVRDPRAIMNSRYSSTSCRNPTCHSTEFLCDTMSQDFHSYTELQQKYPHKIRVVRFEDLLNNPAVQFRKLFQFLTIPYEPVIADRVKKHTYIGTDESNPMVKWKTNLTPSNVSNIESACERTLALFGYQSCANVQPTSECTSFIEGFEL